MYIYLCVYTFLSGEGGGERERRELGIDEKAKGAKGRKGGAKGAKERGRGRGTWRSLLLE